MEILLIIFILTVAGLLASGWGLRDRREDTNGDRCYYGRPQPLPEKRDRRILTEDDM